MKKIIFPVLVFLSVSAFSQNVISAVNAGAVSNNNLVYSVGEIYVVPVLNADEANSGVIGALSRIEFFVSGIDDVISSTDLRIFPNPVSNTLYFESSKENLFKQIFIYDKLGKCVLTTVNNQSSIDLTSITKGIYTIRTDNKNIRSFKIIRN